MTATASWAEYAAREFEEADVFKALGFEPVCKPRVLARLADIPEGLLPEPCGTCPQERFLALPDENIDALYGGAGGGGKSWSLLAYAIRACYRYPGIQVFWFRRSFPELNQSVLRTLARYGYAKRLGAKWDGSKYELRFLNGAVLTFGHAKNLQEAASLSSAEINLLILDERTTIPPDVVDFLYTRIRSGVAGVPCLGARSASNPGHIGHGVVKESYVDATDYGTKEITDAAGRRRIFIPAKATDNPYVGNYDETLQGIADPELRARIRDGDWTAMPDAAFPDWKRDRVVVPAFEIPESWARHGGLDYGWAAPSVYMAAAKDGDGRLWFYRELTMVQTPEREQARQILAANQDAHVRVIAADPAMWGKAGSGLPPADQMVTEGLALIKADNDRLGGKSRMHTYLAEAPACPVHREAGWVTCPLLHVFDGACPMFVKTMGTLSRDPHRPEDVDTDGPDHWYDSGRYLIMAIGMGPQLPLYDLPDEAERIADYVTPLRPMGKFALRDPDGEDDWLSTDNEPAGTRIAVTGTAPWH
jgi:hypothetical protein